MDKKYTIINIIVKQTKKIFVISQSSVYEL